jgi:predicted  nucleic acid-binding Zn-ribbon protein
MNQKIAFYLISTVVVFFIGHSYSQFNMKTPEPVIFNIDNSEEVEQYKSDLISLQTQLDDLDSQLVDSLDSLNSSSKKLNLSSSKVQVLEAEMKIIKTRNNQLQSELTQSESFVIANDNQIKLLTEDLSNALIELELNQFELELANGQAEN